MHAAEIRRAVDAAPRLKLPEVAALLWQAFAEGHVTEVEAESLQAEIEARSSMPRSPALVRAVGNLGISQDANVTVGKSDSASRCAERSRSRAGSKPRTDASMERRRRWAASGRIPPAIAARFTLAEQAALAVIAAETVKRGDCRLALGQIAALAGVSRSTVKNALQEARRHGLITIEERRAAAWRNLSNIVRIVSPEWTAWLRLARRSSNPGSGVSPHGGAQRGGGKTLPSTNTQVSDLGRSGTRKPSRQSGFAQFEGRRAM